MNKGFTLVELAIVVVIIGLLVGGVLQGQELIKQAKIRSQIKQFEEYDAAVAFFRGKYIFIPGDMPASQAVRFGLTSIGDGNGYINIAGAAPNYSSWSGTYSSWSAWNESMYFFPDLATAKLLNISFTTQAYVVNGQFPLSRIADAGIAVIGVNGTNYYFLGPTEKISSYHDFLRSSLQPALTPEEANDIDSKLDDGIPSTGNVRVPVLYNSTDSFVTDVWNFNTCLGATALVYNISNLSKQCRLIIRAKSF